MQKPKIAPTMSAAMGDSGEPNGVPEAEREDGAVLSGYAAADAKVARWRINWRLTGLMGSGSFAGTALFFALTVLNPLEDPSHYVATLLLSFVAGLAVATVVGHNRITDALREKDNYRSEMEKLAERNRRLEDRILDHRMSSTSPSQPIRKRGRR